MGTISARKIDEALSKARDVGLVEEPFTIGDVSIVLRNLRPDELTAIYEENKELEAVNHLFSYQKSHICRSIVEINGADLRDVDFVEVEEEVKDPKTGDPILDPQTQQPKIKKVKLERHAYVRAHILDTWLKETIAVTWRKFTEVLKISEDKAKEGIKFILPEQTPEERFRGLVDDLREALAESNVPEPIVEKVLEEAGLMRTSTAEEIKAAMAKADQFARERQQEEAASAAPPPPPAPPVQGPGESRIPMPSGVRSPSPEEIMARRSPMNRQAVEMPPPQPNPTIAGSPQGPPPVALHRSQRIASVEAVADGLDVPVPPPGDPALAQRLVAPLPGQASVVHPNAPHLSGEKVVLGEKGRDRVDMQQFSTIVGPNQKVGINPRFRPPQRP
jgi:hypothetical protein